MSNTKIYIYGLCNVFYDSYYIQGIKENFSEVEYNVSKFPEFNQGTFAAIISENGKETKLIIDSSDTNKIDLETFNWSDKYGKVNYNAESLISIQNQDKVIAIGPSFGIKIWNLPETLFYAFSHFFKFKAEIKNKREFLANYWRQYKRLPLKEYFLSNSKDNFVFFISSIWKKENATNNFRALFIKECKKNKDLNFDGGFAPRKDGNNFGYDSLLYHQRISLTDYLSKTKNSTFVFNTPAVLSCHGWKLAEFLALGKAIISTPHKNVMPELLDDNIHMVYAENSEDIEEKIKILLADSDFKRKLEINARNYFEKNLEPKVVINRLL